MFTIIGGDGKEYGPATADQIRAWITAGRANLDTKAKALGSEEWRRLGDFAEFAPADATPPVMPPTPPVPPPPGVPAPAVAVAPATPAAPTVRLAGHGARIGAAFINACIYFFSMLPGGTIVGLKMMRDHPELMRGQLLRPGDLEPAMLGQIIFWVYGGVVLVILLQALLIAVRGQNLGKLMVGVRVVRTDGSPAGFVHGTLLRFLLPTAIFLICFVVFFPLAFLFLFVDFCFIFGEQRRCLHDLIADTKVIEK